MLLRACLVTYGTWLWYVVARGDLLSQPIFGSVVVIVYISKHIPQGLGGFFPQTRFLKLLSG